MGTAGAGKNYRFAQWNPVYAHVQETADHKPKQAIRERFNMHWVILNDLKIKSRGKYLRFWIYD
jgi:hypothetical protein